MPDTPSNTPKVTLESLMGQAAAAQPANSHVTPAAATEKAVTERVSALSAADQKKVDDLARQIDFTQSGIEQTFGADAQRGMADFSDRVLEKTRSKDAGQAGELLRELVVTVDDSSLSGVKKVPIIGTIAVKVEQVRREYQKVVPQVDEIVGQLESSRAQMINDIALYDQLYDQSVAQYKQLKIYVAAGAQALADFRADQLPALEAQAAASSDPMAGQVLKDFKSKLDRFEKHLDDLDRISLVALQACPQIKILQNADATIADKIQTTITTTIPLWKSQMVIALGLENQRKAIELQQKVDDVTNRLLRENAEQLHQGAVAAEKANQRGVVDVDTLQHVNDELIATLKDTLEVQRQGRAQRAEAQQKMRTMEGELKAALIEHINS
ncbi:MAG: toxic anion resistance protein [Eggerthellaceae bacterium]|jgi:uncharacterized protein YaaN involved in tellurite resistance|nr:toxic anion resistance protein [Eggerthellaceae bacterium]